MQSPYQKMSNPAPHPISYVYCSECQRQVSWQYKYELFGRFACSVNCARAIRKKLTAPEPPPTATLYPPNRCMPYVYDW